MGVFKMTDDNISKRDYFAGKAMAAMIQSIDSENNYLRFKEHANEKNMSVSEWIATESYKQADAMLSIRLNDSK